MYTVTNEYETYVKSEARNYSMTGSIVNKNNVTMQITRDNILEGSLSFTNRCTANNSFDIGGCCIGSMEITLQGDYHHSLYNAVITLQQGVYVTGDSYHMEKVGTWIIKKAHWNGEWVTLECYDAMCLTQKKYTLTTGSFTPYSFFTAMCNDCGITLATTQAEIEAMVNGTATLIFNGSTQETDRKWSDLIHDMCAVICGFCSINRFGNLEVHQFGRCYKRVGTEKTYYTTAVDTLTKNDRITGGTFGNGAINITGIYINDRASKNADKSILVGNTTGTTLNLGYNRWLSSATSGYATMLQNILTQLTACQFYAADVHLADVSLYDLGDLITLQAGGELSLSEDILMCVMNIDYNFADESTISSYTFSEASDSSTSAVETNLTNRIETLESSGSGKEVYYGTTLPTVDIGQDSSLYYKIIQRPEDLKTLNVVEYIQSVAGTYIPTDILMTNNTRIMMRGIFYRGDYNGGAVAFGIDGRDSDGGVSRFVAGTSAFRGTSNCFFFFGNDYFGYRRSCEGIYETDVMLMADTATRTFTISGGGTSHSVTVPSTFVYTPSSVPIGILCANISSEAGGFEIRPDWRDMNQNAIIKRFQVYNNNILAYDLIPVQNANDVTDCGLYDRIHRKYYPGANYNNNVPFTAGTATGEVINQLDECVEAGYLRVNDKWWEIYNGGTEYFAGNYIEITENNVITSTLKAGTNIQIADDGTISASSAKIVQTVTSGTQLATINDKPIYAPTVSATQTQTSGTEIASINVGDTSTKLYAPTTTVTQTLTEGTEIGEVNGTKLYAPSGGSDVIVTPITTTGTNIANIAVNGTTYQLFAPSGGGGGGGSSGSGYTETSLWSGYKSDTGTINLSDSVENYDIVLIKVTSHPSQPSVKYYESYFTILPSGINYSQNAQYDILTVRGAVNYGNGSIEGYFPSSTSFTIEAINIDSSARNVKPAILEVIGLKFGGGSSGHNYSTEEQVVGTWIDGKPIYEKTYEFATALTINSTSYIHSGITPANIKSLIGMPDIIDVHGQSAPIMAGLYSDREIALASLNTTYSIDLKYLIIRYTKTTD